MVVRALRVRGHVKEYNFQRAPFFFFFFYMRVQTLTKQLTWPKTYIIDENTDEVIGDGNVWWKEESLIVGC